VQSPQERPFVVTVIPDRPAEAKVTTVSDLLIGAVGLAGLMLAFALILGVVFGGLRLALRRSFPSGSDHMPPVRPYDPDSTHPPSGDPQQGSVSQ
jgi:hypothetical protein